MIVYKAMYKYVDGGVHGEVLDFPGAISCGENLEHARRQVEGALLDMAETYILDHRPLPCPNPAATDAESDIEEPIYLLLTAASRIKVTPERASEPATA